MFFIGLVIGAAINALVMALVVMLTSKLITKETPTYGDSFKACFFAAIANGIISYLISLGMGPDAIWIPTFAGLLVAYAVYTISIHKIIGYTLGQSAGVAAITTATMFVLVMGIAFVIGVIIGLSGMAG